MEIIDILKSVSKNEILKESLPLDMKDSLSTLNFEEILFEMKNELLLKRLLLKLIEHEEGSQEVIQQYQQRFQHIVYHGELLIFKNLRDIKKAGLSTHSASIIISEIQLNECIFQLRKNIGNLRLSYLLEYFKNFVECGQIHAFVELMIMVLETLDRARPEISKELDSYQKLEQQEMQQEETAQHAQDGKSRAANPAAA